MRIIDIHEAKEQFFALVDAVSQGSEILIGMAGKPVAKLGHVTKKPQRKFGVLKGKVKISKDFDAPLSDKIIAG
jgi:prevent-host-death family protein